MGQSNSTKSTITEVEENITEYEHVEHDQILIEKTIDTC